MSITFNGRDRRMRPRYEINIRVRIFVRSIGNSHKFEFFTKDISETGLLLNTEQNHKLIFNQHSILEVWLCPDNYESIFFYAKFVRYADDHSIGIRVSDIDTKNRELYYRFIEDQIILLNRPASDDNDE